MNVKSILSKADELEAIETAYNYDVWNHREMEVSANCKITAFTRMLIN